MAERGDELRLGVVGPFRGLSGQVGLVVGLALAGGPVVIDGDRGEVAEPTDEFLLTLVGFVRGSVVDGERTDDLGSGADGARPAGTDVVGSGELAEVEPPGVGGDVVGDDRFAEVDCGAAGPCERPGGEAVDGIGVVDREARCSSVAENALIVEQQHRAATSGDQLLEGDHDAVEDVGQRGVGSE